MHTPDIGEFMTRRIAVAQMTSSSNIDDNFAQCEFLTNKAVTQGANLICLPENFAFMGTADQDNLAIAEPLDGPLLQRYRDLAKKCAVWLSLGGFPRKK